MEINHKFSIDDFLTDMEKRNVKPNRNTYELMISKHCIDGNLEDAGKILQHMKDSGFLITKSVFHSFITGNYITNIFLILIKIKTL